MIENVCLDWSVGGCCEAGLDAEWNGLLTARWKASYICADGIDVTDVIFVASIVRLGRVTFGWHVSMVLVSQSTVRYGCLERELRVSGGEPGIALPLLTPHPARLSASVPACCHGWCCSKGVSVRDLAGMA